MLPNEQIAQRRKDLHLSLQEVSTRTGLSVNEYLDIEGHPHEVWEVVRLRDLRRVCQVLGIDMSELLGLQHPSGAQASALAADFERRRHLLIREAREAKNLTCDALADRIGFDRETVKELETNPDRLEDWPVALIQALASELSLPPTLLIHPDQP